MRLDKLVNCINTLKSRIETHHDILTEVETRTRVALIDPLLSALGWDVSDPSVVVCEDSVDSNRESKKKADYVLMRPDSKKIAVLEAKKLGELGPLDHRKDTKSLDQIHSYAGHLGCIYGGVTDGNFWRLYRFEHGIPLNDMPKVLDICLRIDPSVESALKLLVLWRSNLETNNPVEAEKPLIDESQSELIISPVIVQQALPPDPSNWVSLSNYDARHEDVPPKSIRFWDGSELPIKPWKDIIVNVVRKLYETKRLTERDIPLRLHGSKNYLVHTKSVHASGEKFQSPKKIAGTPLVVEAHGGKEEFIRKSKKLFTLYNVDHGTVHLKVK